MHNNNVFSTFAAMKENDVIIIGSGLGGLTAGATLANKGKKVLLIEQHFNFGGCATNFKRKGCEIDASLHLLDGLGKRDNKYKIFKELGIFDNLEFLLTPEFYDFTTGDSTISIPYGMENNIELLISKFPKEEKGIRTFFEVLGNIRSEVDKIGSLSRVKRSIQLPFASLIYPYTIKYLKQNIGDFVDSIINDEKLKLTLVANVCFYHDDPYQMSMIFFCCANGSFYRDGGYYIKGGSQKLSDYLAKIIRDNGGELIGKHLVSSILIEDNKAVGVEYHSLKSEDTKKKAYAKYVISNASIPDVAHKLLPEHISSKLKNKIKKLEAGPSISTLYMVFNKESKELGGKAYSLFGMEHDRYKLKDYKSLSRSDYTERPYLYTDYGVLDSQLAVKGKNCATLCVIDYLEDWSELPEDEYTAKKEAVAQMLIARLGKHIPNIEEHLEHYELSTPRTIKRYVKTPKGAIYGYAQTPKQALNKRIKYKSTVKNLYFSSAWNFPGGGYAGTISSGWNCAQTLLKKNNF